MIVVAQADIDDSPKSRRYQDELKAILERDDIAAASRFVESLAGSADIEPSLINSMDQQIWRTKAARMIEYSERIREAIASSDLASMKLYSQRMQRLVAATSSENPVPSTPDFGNEPSTKAVADAPPSDGGAAPDPAVELMLAALKDGHYIGPEDGNAFDLAAARLAETQNDSAALAVVDEVVGEMQADVANLLQEDQSGEALGQARGLLDAFSESDAQDVWRSGYRAKLDIWFDQLQPKIAAGLIDRTETAIDRRDLMVAGDESRSAMDYLLLLASLNGTGNEDVTELAARITASYRDLVDYRLTKQDYAAAMTFVQRMETVASRFDLSLDEAGTLRRNIETAEAKQRRHDEFMSLATQSREMGQLIKPSGANAIEFTAKAIKLAVNPSAANEVLDDLIAEQRQRIDLLIEARRFRDAGLELESFAAAMDKAGIDQETNAADLRAEADALLQKAAVEESLRQQQTVKEAIVEARPSPSAPPDKQERRTAKPFTFINPF